MNLRIKQPLFPRRSWVEPLELKPLVQSRGTVAPELDLDRLEPIATPVVGPRDRAAVEPPFVRLDRRLQSGARGKRPRLLARPGANLAPPWPGGEIGVALGAGQFGDRAAEPGLAAKRLPVEERRRPRLTVKLTPLGALDVGIEDETARVRALAQDHPRVGQSIGVDGGERHRLRIVDLRGYGFRKPELKERERVGGLSEVDETQVVQGEATPVKGLSRIISRPAPSGQQTPRPCVPPGEGPNVRGRHGLPR